MVSQTKNLILVILKAARNNNKFLMRLGGENQRRNFFKGKTGIFTQETWTYHFYMSW